MGERKTATLGWLAELNDAKLHFDCGRSVYVEAPHGTPGERFELHRLKSHYGMTIGAAEAAARWGADIMVWQLERRARCIICGGRGARIDVSSPLNSETIRMEIERRS